MKVYNHRPEYDTESKCGASQNLTVTVMITEVTFLDRGGNSPEKSDVLLVNTPIGVTLSEMSAGK